jgi:serine/threonine-protein phosphatase PP1 catalytic subunit
MLHAKFNEPVLTPHKIEADFGPNRSLKFEIVQSPMSYPEIVTHFQKHLMPLLRLLPEETEKVGTRIPIPSFDSAQIHSLIQVAQPIFAAQAKAVIDIPFPSWVIGDIHGNFHDLIRIIGKIDPDGTTPALFLGDYVDRGCYSLEVLLALFTLKVLDPMRFFFIRGNHEFAAMNAEYGFKDELDQRYPDSGLWEAFTTVFDLFPLAAILGETIICLHGGIGPHVPSIDRIKSLTLPICESTEMVTEIVWADPTSDSETPYIASARGSGYMFGPLALKEFLKASQCERLLRAHQCVSHGLDTFAYGKGLTVFSSSNYMGHNNAAAIILIDTQGQVVKEQFEPLSQAVVRANAVYAEVCPVAAHNGRRGVPPGIRRGRSRSEPGELRLLEAPSIRRFASREVGLILRRMPTAPLVAKQMHLSPIVQSLQ